MARDPDRIIPLRHYGRWLLGGLVVILVALVVKAFAQGRSIGRWCGSSFPPRPWSRALAIPC